MKVVSEADKLAKELAILQLIQGTKNLSTEDKVAFKACDEALIAYTFGKGHWGRVQIPLAVEVAGVVIVERARFFRLLSTLKGKVTLSSEGARPNHLKIKTNGGLFTLPLGTEIPPRPNLLNDADERSVGAAPLYKQLRVCVLDGELIGGGYKLSRKNGWFELVVSDRQRLIRSLQQDFGLPIDLTIPPAAIRGVFEILRETGNGNITIKASRNVTSLSATLDGVQKEFGYQNSAEVFPDVSMILGVKDHTSTATFEVDQLLDAVNSSGVLADEELIYGDFTFLEDETCQLLVRGVNGSAEVGIVNVPNEGPQTENTLRLQLKELTGFLKKIKELGATFAHVRWGGTRPVIWTPDFETEPNNIDLTLIMAPLRQPEKTKEAAV